MKVLSKVKEEMEFNQGLQSLVETLKSIAVSHFRVLEDKIKTFDEFFVSIGDFFALINDRGIDHPFVSSGNGPKLVAAVTSDKGLLGGLNRQVMAIALDKIKSSSDRLVIIGGRGKVFAEEYGIPSTVFPGIDDKQRYSQAMQLRDYLVQVVLKNKMGSLVIVYPEAESFTHQQIKAKRLIPYDYNLRSSQDKQSEGVDLSGIVWESNRKDFIEYLIYLLIGQQIYDIFAASRLAELGARFVHLEGSSQKLEKKNKSLKSEYFHIRHELIDRNMRELFSVRSLVK